VPADKPLNIDPDWNVVPLSILNCRFPVPLEALMVMDPLLELKQLLFVVFILEIIGASVLLIDALIMVVHPFASVTKTGYVPASNPVNVLEGCDVVPLLMLYV
jgi:hypothetical protein